MLRHAKKGFYSNKLKQVQNNIKGTWSVMKNILGKSSKSFPKHFTCENRQVDDPKQIAGEFNSHFINSCNQAINTMRCDDYHLNFTDYLKEPNSNSLFFKPITENEIIETCKSLHNSKSCGFDNISSVI